MLSRLCVFFVELFAAIRSEVFVSSARATHEVCLLCPSDGLRSHSEDIRSHTAAVAAEFTRRSRHLAAGSFLTKQRTNQWVQSCADVAKRSLTGNRLKLRLFVPTNVVERGRYTDLANTTLSYDLSLYM